MGDLEVAKKLLNRDDIGFSKDASTIRLMRKADVLYLEKRNIKALVTYLQLNDTDHILKQYPDSLAKFCDLLYEFKRYKQAEKNYRILSDSLANKPQYDLVLFRLAMSRAHNGATASQIKKELHLIREAFDNSEGAYRATMKNTDIDFLSGNYKLETIENAYKKLSIEAITIALREEAIFKLALLNLFNGEPEAAVQICLNILREFQNGILKIETRALIIQQLPKVIKNLVKNESYIAALVLAQKNRDLFSRGWISNALLYDLATAYRDLGFFDRAARTYQYLFDVSNGDEQEKIYLPLIEALYQDGQYQFIENYADRFSFRYPESDLLSEIFLLRLEALIRMGDIETTSVLLDNPERPKSQALDNLAVEVYYEQERWNDVINKLTRDKFNLEKPLPQTQKKILAESYYQRQEYAKSATLFQQLIDEQGMNEHALFRLAQVDLEAGNTEQALKRFKEIAEKGKEPAWKKLAREEIAILKLQ
ncbi:MAG: tetratricopeptide repeat protein [Desulfobulbaceae bacterium]|nr:tetratricopeptide repeat protein [Desulfobulbaceae bacterium]